MAEVIKEDKTGWLCNPYEKNSISNEILKVVNMDENIKRKISLEAKEQLKNLNAEKICLETLELYERTIKEFNNV